MTTLHKSDIGFIYFDNESFNYIEDSYVSINNLINDKITKNKIIKLLNKYNGIEIYEVKIDINNKKILNNTLKLLLKLKFNIDIDYREYNKNDIIVIFNKHTLYTHCMHFMNNINDIKEIYNIFNNFKNIEKFNKYIIFDNEEHKQQFIYEYNEL